MLTMSILNSCKKDVNTFIVGINIEAAFNQDNVQNVYMDKKKLMLRLPIKELWAFALLIKNNRYNYCK